MAVNAQQQALIQAAARRGAALIRVTKSATGEANVETLVSRAMADLRAFAAVADADTQIITTETFALLNAMTEG